MNYVEFWVKEVFKCRERRMMPYDEEWTKAQAWGCPRDTPRNIQEVQASKIGDAQGIPSSSIKSTRSFFNALYFYCFMHYLLFLERLYFLLCVYCFHKVGPHHILFWRETWSAASYILWSETRSAILHIYFGVRHAPLLCIFILE